MTDIEILRLKLNKIISYPPGLEKIDCGIIGKGFFPGARGLSVDGDQTLSDKQIMILGHDFGAKVDYEKSIKRGCENQSALTWSNLNKMLINCEISENACFFTNCIMGIRTSGESAMGRSVGYKHDDFLKDCKKFLIMQIDIQRPKLIISLGLNTLDFLSELAPTLSKLSKVRSFKKLDNENLSVFKDVEFFDLPNFKANLVIATHPTYRHLNVWRRKYEGLTGQDAEKETIKKLK